MRRKQFGAAAIEFALILPLYVLLIDGVMEFSLVLYDQAIVLNAARQAVRAGVVLADPKLDNAEIAAVAHRYAVSYLVSSDSANTVTVVVNQSPGGAYQSPLTVRVAYRYTSFMAGSMLSAVHIPLVLSSSVTAMNE